MRLSRRRRPHQHDVHDARPPPQRQRYARQPNGWQHGGSPQDCRAGAEWIHTQPQAAESSQPNVSDMEGIWFPRTKASQGRHARTLPARSDRRAAAAATRVSAAAARVSTGEHDASTDAHDAAESAGAADDAARDGRHAVCAATDAAAAAAAAEPGHGKSEQSICRIRHGSTNGAQLLTVRGGGKYYI